MNDSAPNNGLFFDLSLECTGWTADSPDASVESGRQSFIKIPKGFAPAIRLRNYANWLEQSFEVQNPEVVVFEEPHMAFKNAIYALVPMVSRLQEICAVYGIPCYSVHTQTLKLQATGFGNASKEAMKAAAASYYRHYDPALDPGGDEADSLMIRHVYRTQGLEAILPKKRATRPKKPKALVPLPDDYELNYLQPGGPMATPRKKKEKPT